MDQMVVARRAVDDGAPSESQVLMTVTKVVGSVVYRVCRNASVVRLAREGTHEQR